jgi:N-methylhydantoinase B
MDPVTLAVLDNRLRAIVEEMGEAMLRTSYSQILNSSRDFSVALCGADGGLVAQADHIPVHVGALRFAVEAALEQFPNPRDGDIFLLNDPYNGGSHLPDLTIMLPVFAEGQRCFFAVVRAHVPDIGGATHGGYNPGATDIWSEGVRIPPIRLGEDGGLREDLIRMLCANTRVPRDVRGDLMAMVGAARVGAARVTALLAQQLQALRRNHALEHATLHVLAQQFPQALLAGRADARGFVLYGSVPGAAVQAAAHSALATHHAQC